MNIKIYILLSWIFLSRISVYFALALDLEPWLPKSSELYLDTTNQLYVVQGIKLHKYPLQSKNLSSIRCMNFRSMNQLYAAGSGFIDVYSTETSESNFDTIQSFYNRAGNIHDFIFYEDSLLAITDNGLYKYLDNDFDARSDGEPELLISWKIQAGTQLSVTKSDSSIFYICGSWDTLDIPGKNQIENINGIIEYLAEDNNVSVVAYGLNNPISLTSNIYHDLFCFDQGDANGFLLPHKKPNQLVHIPIINIRDPHHFLKVKGTGKNHAASLVSHILDSGSSVFRDIVEYHHYMFSTSFFYGGHFATDWLNGRLLFFKLEPQGSSYSTVPYLVAKSAGLNGWAPSALTVSPEGSLIVAHSLSGSKGALYRVTPESPDIKPDVRTEMDAVLKAAQPRENWSEKAWRPLANNMENDEFIEVIIRDSSTSLEKIMAVNALASKKYIFGTSLSSNLNNQVSPDLLTMYLRMHSDESLPDIARWLEKVIPINLSVFSQRKALEFLSSDNYSIPSSVLSSFIFKSCFSTDYLISKLARKQIINCSENRWKEALKPKVSYTNRESALILERKVSSGTESMESLISELTHLINSSGDLNVISECVDITCELFSFTIDNLHFRISPDNTVTGNFIETWHRRIKSIYPTRDGFLNEKLAGLTVVLGINDSTISNRFAANITTKLPTSKLLHFLNILLINQSDIPARFHKSFAESIVSLSRQAIIRTTIEDMVSYEYVLTILQKCFSQWSWLPDKISGIKQFPSPEDMIILQFLPTDMIDSYLLDLFTEYESESHLIIYPSLIDALAHSSMHDKEDRISRLWQHKNLQRSITKYFSSTGAGVHIKNFIESLESADDITRIYGLKGIVNMSPTQQLDPQQLAKFIRALSLSSADLLSDMLPELVTFFEAQDPTFAVSSYPDSITNLYQQMLTTYTRTYHFPEKYLELDPNDDPAHWNIVFSRINWKQNDIETGKAIFYQRNCSNCHGPNNYFGPQLKFNNMDKEQSIAESIIFPHRNIAPEFNTYLVHIENYQFMGFLVAIGMNNAVFTLNSDTSIRGPVQNFKLAEPAAFSIMPGGLLDGLDDYQIASLIAYLKSMASF